MTATPVRWPCDVDALSGFQLLGRATRSCLNTLALSVFSNACCTVDKTKLVAVSSTFYCSGDLDLTVLFPCLVFNKIRLTYCLLQPCLNHTLHPLTNISWRNKAEEYLLKSRWNRRITGSEKTQCCGVSNSPSTYVFLKPQNFFFE